MPLEIKLDDPRLKKAGWHVSQQGPAVATIHLIRDDGKVEDMATCSVAIIDGKLSFLPQRSGAQRKVLARMGLP